MTRIILEVTTGPLTGSRITLPDNQRGTVGRGGSADYHFPDDGLMSGRHFAIEWDGAQCRVLDLGSSGGTYLNGERVSEGVLQSGSLLRAGSTSFRVAIEEVVAPQAPPVAMPVVAGAASAHTVAGTAPQVTPVRSAVHENQMSSDGYLDDPDPVVRRNAMINAAWTGSTGIIDHCRRAASAPAKENWDALVLLALLGLPSDAERLRFVGRAAQLGPRRYEILGMFGHPVVVADLFVGMENKDPATSAAAGAAFTKMTGVDIGSGERAEVEPEKGAGAAEFEKEFQDEVMLPSIAMATRHWKDQEQRYMQGARWCRGIDVSRGLPPGAEDSLDLESLWEAALRGRFAGVQTASRLQAEQLAVRLS